MTIQIKSQPTRSETLVTFTLNRALVAPGTGKPFPNRTAAQAHPIAKAIFEVPGVESVWLLGNDIQVGKSEYARWSAIKSKVEEAIRAALD